MVYSRNYARMFVTLKQESADYSSNFKEAMGRCVIEVRSGKGKISLYIQGLKKGEYSLILISCKNGKNVGVKAGKVSTDLNGKGEFKTEFDPENVCGTDFKIEDFHVVTIMPFGHRGDKALLTGYTGGVVKWKEDFYILNDNTKIYDKTEQMISENESTEISEMQNESTEILETTNENENQNDEKIETAEKITEAVLEQVCTNKEENLSSVNVKKLSEESANFNKIVKNFKKEISNIETSKENLCKRKLKESYKKNVNYGIEYIFEKNLKMTPFQNQNKNINWIRIGLNELILLPNRIWLYINNPFICFSEKKYKHLILGRFLENGNEKYILGVPGRYFTDYHFETELKGFKNFKCCENKVPVEGDYGYWLLNIK